MFERLRRRSGSSGLSFSLASLEGVAENSPNLLGISCDGVVVFFNATARRLLGASHPSALVGRDVLDVFHPSERARIAPLLARVSETGVALTWTVVRLVDLEGHDFDLEVTAARIEYQGRGALLLVGRNLHDVRRVHDALQASERRYETLAAVAPVAIYRLDLRGHIVYVNQRWLEITGIPRDEAIGRSWLDLVSDRGKAHADEIWRAIVSGEGEYRGEHELIQRGGATLQILTHVAPEKDASGRAAGWIGTLVDVTAIKAAERALADSEEHLRVAFDAAKMASWEVDLESGRVSWSPNAAQVLDAAPHLLALTAPELWSAIRPSEVSFREGSARESLARGEPFQVEARFQRGGGTPRWMLVRGQARPAAGGRGRRVIGVVADVTAQRQLAEERARLEEKLLEAQRLESLGLLAGGIAHDFNNLLVGILGNAELALARIPEASPARVLVEDVREASVRAAELAHQILAYSGREPVSRGPVDLAKLGREVLGPLRASLRADARLELEAPPRAVHALGDETQLRQVLMNLVTNACQSLPESGGSVRVRLLPAQLASHRDDPTPDWIVLEVADDGCGMSAQTRARVFDPFFTTRPTGRGLGLAVVHGIVRGHGGTIEIESEPGAGTCVRVQLPACGEPSLRSDPPPRPRSERDFRGALVGFVDDERAVREVARIALESAGFRVCLASNATETRALLAEHGAELALVVLDLSLGLDSSETVLAGIRARAPHVPVLVTSGYPEEEAIGRLAKLGVSGFVQKPFTPSKLVAGIESALDEARATR